MKNIPYMIVPFIGLTASKIQRELVLTDQPDEVNEPDEPTWSFHPLTIFIVITFVCCCPLCFLLGLGHINQMGRAFMDPNRDKLAYFKGVINIITFSTFGYMGLF